MFKLLQEVEKQITLLFESNKLEGHPGEVIHSFADIVWKLARLTVLENKEGGDARVRSDKKYFPIGNNENRYYKLDHTPIDSILDHHELILTEDIRHSQANAIREWLNQDLPSKGEIEDVLLELQKIFERFTEDLKIVTEDPEKAIERLKKDLEKTRLKVEGKIIHKIPKKLDFIEGKKGSKKDGKILTYITV